MSLKFTNQDDAIKALPHLDPIVATILYGRGIIDVESATKYLNPDYTAHSHSGGLMKDMDKAVGRVLSAIRNKERIVVFTDYDADGIPGAVMWHDFLTKIDYDNFQIYIPHRHDEGFGLSESAIQKFINDKTDLLITLDCGITDVPEIKIASDAGIDVIITDHHLPGEVMPDAYAIVNPQQSDCDYPEKILCGSGVAYKLIQAVIKKGREEKVFEISDGWEKWLLDMVGIATLSDMVTLTGENRVLASFGLRVLRKSPRVGLQKLLTSLKVNQASLSEEDVGFSIAPRINVASRMSDPRKAFELLSTTSQASAGLLVAELEGLNAERKSIVATIVKEIKKKLREDETIAGKPILFFGHTHWKPAVLGLASNSIMREVGKPVFVWGREGGEFIKGSCRSDGTINLVDLMNNVSPGVFVDFGGHAFSGGFSIDHNHIADAGAELLKAYEKIAKKVVTEETIIDGRLNVDQIGRELWNKVNVCAPFGMGNPRPLFLFENTLVSEVKKFGKAKEHIELRLQGENGRVVSAIQFFAAENDKFKDIEAGSRINLLAHLEESLFKSYPEYRLRIVDIVEMI